MTPPSHPTVESLLEHATFARRLARALVLDDARADDVVQQAWVSALEHPPRPDDDAARAGGSSRRSHGLKAWLATVIRNSASKLRREESRRERREQHAATPERLPPASDVAAQLAAQRALVDAVAWLEEPYRSTVHARWFEERTPTQIAKAQAVPVRTVETRLRRALEQMRADLDRRFAGGRDAWAGLLVPLGGAVMSAKSAIGIAAGIAALVIGTGAVLHFGEEARDGELASSRAAASSAVAGASPPQPHRPAAAAVDATDRERDTPLVAERTATSCSVRVLDPDGDGVASASLVLFRDDVLLGESRTDGSGAARLPVIPAGEPECELYVEPGCAPWRTIAVAPGTTSIDFVIEEGARLEGRVVVEGGPPRGTMRLTVAPFPQVKGSGRFPPLAVQRALKRVSIERVFGNPISAVPDAVGRFAVFGLGSCDHITVTIPVPFEDADRGGSSVQTEPRTDFLLSLRYLPSIRGRVVDRAGDPVAGWKVAGTFDALQESQSLIHATSEADGRFELYVHPKPAPSRAVTVRVRDPAGVELACERREGSFDRGGEFGDVVVDRTRLLALDARDEEGRAIDPFVVFVGRGRRAAGETGREKDALERRVVVDAAHARAGFGVPAEVGRVSVLAAGFAATSVPPEPGSRAVTLARCASLSVSLRDEEQKPIPHVSLEISSSRWPIAWTRAELLAAHQFLRGAQVLDDETKSETRARFWSQGGGVMRVVALVPELPLDVVMRDWLGVELHRETVTLAKGEKRVLQWRLATPPTSTLAGTVRSAGAPLAGARVVFFTNDRERHVDATADRDGRFRIEGIRAPRGTLVVEFVNHISQQRDGVEVGAGREHDFDLVRGRQLWCRFNGEKERVTPDEVWIERRDPLVPADADDRRPPPGTSFDLRATPIGLYISDVLPFDALVVRARVDGFVHHFVLHDSAGHSAGSRGMPHVLDFDVNLRGPVVIDWTIAGAASEGRTLTALRLTPHMGNSQITLALAQEDVEKGTGVARFEKVRRDLYTVALVWADATGELTEERTDLKLDLEHQQSVQATLAK